MNYKHDGIPDPARACLGAVDQIASHAAPPQGLSEDVLKLFRLNAVQHDTRVLRLTCGAYP